MDKQRFVAQAPHYYALALVHYFLYNRSSSIISTIQTEFMERDHESEDVEFFLHQDFIIKHALKWMLARDLITLDEDHFGPAIISPSDNFTEQYEKLCTDISLPFSKYSKIPQSRAWLMAALREIDKQYYRLKINNQDFESPDAEWEPLPIDRGDPLVHNMTDRLDEVYEQVRSDNGYADSFPEERQHVLSALDGTLKRLRESASVSLAYIKRNALEPLNQVYQRFGKAPLGVVVQTSIEAFKQWLKSKGVTILDNLF